MIERFIVGPARGRRRPRPVVLWVLVAFALVAAACGGGSATDDAASDAAVSDAGSGSVAVDADGNGGGSGDVATYCAYSVSKAQRDRSFSFADATPEQAEAYFTQSRSDLVEALEIVPEQIRADLRRAVAEIDIFIGILSGGDWSFPAVTEALQAIPADPESAAGDSRLHAFDEQFCGLVEGNPTGPGGDSTNPNAMSPEEFESLLATEQGRQQLIDSFSVGRAMSAEQAGCFFDSLSTDVLYALAFVATGPTAPQLDQLFAAFEACDISADQFSAP
jgi:hypothetical protein